VKWIELNRVLAIHDKNGYSLNASDQGIVSAIRSIASGRIPEAELAEWIREYLAGR
jgi:prophage maintenance system killer protein